MPALAGRTLVLFGGPNTVSGLLLLFSGMADGWPACATICTRPLQNCTSKPGRVRTPARKNSLAERGLFTAGGATPSRAVLVSPYGRELVDRGEIGRRRAARIIGAVGSGPTT